MKRHMRFGIAGLIGTTLLFAKSNPSSKEQNRSIPRKPVRPTNVGFCTLKMIVETDGRPSNIRVVGHAGMGLDENAIEAVKKWKFDPSTHAGEPVPVEITVEVVFHL